MKILLYTQLWKRPELTELVFKQITSIKRDGYEFIPFAVLSEESMIPLCEKYGVKYAWAENLPLGKKHNVGLQEALKLEWDYYFNFGSDDLVSEKIFDLYEPYLKRKADFFGLQDVWFYDVYSERMCHYSYPYTKSVFGAGRVCSRKMIERIKGRSTRIKFWPDHMNSGLDNGSRNIAEQHGYDNLFIRTKEPVIIDVKTDVNLWDYDSYQGKPKEFTDLEGYYSEEILNELKELKTDKPKITRKMNQTVTKIYESLRYTRKSYKRGDQRDYVVFENGMDKGRDGRQFGKYATADPEIQRWLEGHPLYGKEFTLRNAKSEGETNKERDARVAEEAAKEKELAELRAFKAQVEADAKKAPVIPNEAKPEIPEEGPEEEDNRVTVFTIDDKEEMNEPPMALTNDGNGGLKTVPATPDPGVTVVEEVNQIGKAKAWLKEHTEATAEEIKNGAAIKEYIEKNNIEFPKLFPK